MRVTAYGTKPYDRRFLDAANCQAGHEIVYFDERLSEHTAKAEIRLRPSGGSLIRGQSGFRPISPTNVTASSAKIAFQGCRSRNEFLRL